MANGKAIFILFKKLTVSILLVITCLLGLIYFKTTIYNFPPSTLFSGDSLINPYQNIVNKSIKFKYDLPKSLTNPDSSRQVNFTNGKILKCNFHAHSSAWGGVTNGHNSPEEITRAYTAKGYKVAAISNYHSILPKAQSQSPIYLPVYEHGYNIFKSHELAINAAHPSYFDFPLWQSTSQKQVVINEVHDNASLVAIAHPKFMNGHTLDDMAQLTNYQLVEVLNHYRISDEYWDAALTAGRLVYGIGNDDTHDINNEPTFKMWTEVYADTASAEGVVSALKQGKSYMVHAEGGERDIALHSLYTINDSVVNLVLDGNVEHVETWGPGHKLIGNADFTKDKFSDGLRAYMYLPTKYLAYFRFVIKSAKCTIYLNPIVRSKDGKTAGIGSAQPTVNIILTFLYRLIMVVITCFAIALLVTTWRKKHA